jgi:pyruvate dehydrogenase E2 component (dihydrolipoamide acetyltransferase)
LVEVPEIGDFDEVPIIEILVSAGDAIAADDPLLTLESAVCGVPGEGAERPAAGTVVGMTEVRAPDIGDFTRPSAGRSRTAQPKPRQKPNGSTHAPAEAERLNCPQAPKCQRCERG